MNEQPHDRVTKWLVGDRLASVLHLGDSSLAYTLCDQGHEVVVAGDDVVGRRHPEIIYVQSDIHRLPFASSSFDVIVAPHLNESLSTFAEFARVLRRGGWLSTMSRQHDESIPWLRKLREIIGMREPVGHDHSDLISSGLFETPEELTGSAWEVLDLDALMRFARANRHPSVPDSSLNEARALFATYAAQTGVLRLRHETRCMRVRVDKSQLDESAETPATVLLDFS